jgi:hypothetical protein
MESQHTQFEADKNLLRDMELLDDESDHEGEEVDQVLNKAIVAAIEIARGIDPKLDGGVKDKKAKEAWGPIFVGRHRRVQNKCTSMMQKTMEF